MFIYKITNLINNKIYIGQTIYHINKRWIQHISGAKNGKYKNPLHHSIKKYGKENFQIEEIDGANSISELNYKEFILIYKFNSLAPHGYNLKEGGNRPKYSKETREKMSKSAKIRANKKKHKDRMIFNNPMCNLELIRKRSEKVKKEKTYCGKNNGRYVKVDSDKLKELYLSKDKYWTHKDLAKYFNVGINCISRKIKLSRLTRKIKKPNFSNNTKKENNNSTININIDKLKELYFDKDNFFSCSSIAKYFNVSDGVIYRRLKWLKMKR